MESTKATTNGVGGNEEVSGCSSSMDIEEYVEECRPALSGNNLREEPIVLSFCNDDDVLSAGPSSSQSTEAHSKTNSTGMQTTCSSIEVNNMTKQIDNMNEQIKILKRQVNAHLPLVQFEQQLGANDEMCKFYTGLNSVQLEILRGLSEVDKINYWGSSINDSDIETSTKPQGRSRTYTQGQELILLLIILRGGLLLEDIAYRFSLSSTFVRNIVITWLLVLSQKFNSIRPHMFPSREHTKESLMTNRFRKFKNIRVVIDCVEIRCEKLSFNEQGNPDSECSEYTTYKFLIGCAPNGAVTFVSDAMDGSFSDKDIVERSGLISLLEEGDLVLADRGFTRSDDGSTSKIPAFLKVRDILISREVMETKEVNANRIFNKHIAERIESFRIFHYVVPLFLRPMLSEAVFVCACILNFYPPLIE